MFGTGFREILLFIQHAISFLGTMVILSGILIALYQYFYHLLIDKRKRQDHKINEIRLNLGKTLILGLEFIVAADLIGTTTAPDYYSVGILAIIVFIRTLLSFSLSKELMGLTKEQAK